MIELPGDSWDYDLIYKGVELSKDVEGLCLELGLRRGGGTKYIIDSVVDNCPDKVVVGIDPYGSILYEHKQDHFVRLDYDEDMKCESLSNIYQYVKEKKVHFIFINLEDSEFFSSFEKGVPVYKLEKKIINKYSFVHFDGPHSVPPIIREIKFFLERIDKGACFCFDDVSKLDIYYNHDIVEDFLFKSGFKLIEKRDKKALYQYEN